jgi:hypothetical protein
MQRNKLLMNAKKSCYSTFGYSVNPDICIRIVDDVLGYVDSVKNLGVIIDEQLNFGNHIELLESFRNSWHFV